MAHKLAEIDCNSLGWFVSVDGDDDLYLRTDGEIYYGTGYPDENLQAYFSTKEEAVIARHKYTAKQDADEYIRPTFEEEYTGEKPKQVGGSHYIMPIEPIDYIVKNELGYREGNVVKYVSRHQKKNGAEDIKKAIHYLEMILSDYEKENK